MGTYLWDLCLDKYNGDGRSHGETFLGELWIFFLGGWGSGRGTPGHVLLSRFHRTTRVSKQSFLCCILYIDQWGFSIHHVSDNRERYPVPVTTQCM
jgi:hypothetical protein